jgi:hypothetical protein
MLISDAILDSWICFLLFGEPLDIYLFPENRSIRKVIKMISYLDLTVHLLSLT